MRAAIPRTYGVAPKQVHSSMTLGSQHSARSSVKMSATTFGSSFSNFNSKNGAYAGLNPQQTNIGESNYDFVIT
jgi:hypothetical protein